MPPARESTTATRAGCQRSTVHVEPDGTGGALVVLAGEIDQDCASELRDVLASALRAHPGRVVLDLAGLTFCDCACLNILLRARQEAGIRFGVRNISAPVSRLLRSTDTFAYFLNGADPGSHPAEEGTGRI